VLQGCLILTAEMQKVSVECGFLRNRR
jgi:hypothetical protein